MLSSLCLKPGSDLLYFTLMYTHTIFCFNSTCVLKTLLFWLTCSVFAFLYLTFHCRCLVQKSIYYVQFFCPWDHEKDQGFIFRDYQRQRLKHSLISRQYSNCCDLHLTFINFQSIFKSHSHVKIYLVCVGNIRHRNLLTYMK